MMPSDGNMTDETTYNTGFLSRELKAARIVATCDSRNIAELANLTTSEHGLVNDDIRRVAWPILLGCHGDSDTNQGSDWILLPRHRDEDQVKLDVDRAFVYYPIDESDKQILKRREDLQSLITEVLRKQPFLCYFQGYHDIVQVLLLVLGRSRAYEAIARLSVLRIRDFMLPTLGPAITHLRLLPAILAAADADVARHLSELDPFFALASTLTLYAHDIEEYGDIARLYDFLISQEAVISLYLFAVIIVSRRAQLLDIEADESELMHSVLSKLPMPLDLEKWISDAMALYRKHPPESLHSTKWRWLSSNSVLKTTRDPVMLAKQSLADGEKMFRSQEREMRLHKLLQRLSSSVWSYRRRYGTIGLAVVVAAVSYWVRRDTSYATSVLFHYWQKLRHLLRY